VSVLLAVEGHDILLVSSYEQRGTVDAVAQRFHPGHIERTGTVDIRDWKRTETHTHILFRAVIRHKLPGNDGHVSLAS